MHSLILQTAVRFLFPLFLLYSIFVLLVGHDEPGGGFIGGLVAASAFALYSFAFNVPTARRLFRADPRTVIGLGMTIATLSGFAAAVTQKPFYTGIWTEIIIPGLGVIKIGSPLFFDIGVYLVVVGITLLLIFTLAEE